jgi:hypothetical protein
LEAFYFCAPDNQRGAKTMQFDDLAFDNPFAAETLPDQAAEKSSSQNNSHRTRKYNGSYPQQFSDRAPKNEITPTQEQSDIILTPLQPGKILSIQAAAGCAKTIWQLAPVFGQLGSRNEKAELVVDDDDSDGAGRKSGGWSMNLKRADCKGVSSAKAAAWR